MAAEYDDIKDPFGGVLAVKRKIAFKALSIGRTRGHELIRSGVLEVADLGPRSKPITVESIRRALRDGVTNKVGSKSSIEGK